MSDKAKNDKNSPKALTVSQMQRLKEKLEKSRAQADKIPKGTFKEVL